MPTSAVNGIQVNYADSGGEGPVVVRSHGLLLDQSMFDAQVAALAPEYRVITWDQRGHGGTPAPGPFSYWDSARDVLALLDHLGIRRAVLGGMSQGGFLSLRAALLALSLGAKRDSAQRHAVRFPAAMTSPHRLAIAVTAPSPDARQAGTA